MMVTPCVTSLLVDNRLRLAKVLLTVIAIEGEMPEGRSKLIGTIIEMIGYGSTQMSCEVSRSARNERLF